MALLLTLLEGSKELTARYQGTPKTTSWTSWLKVSNHTTLRIYRLALNCNWITIKFKHARKVCFELLL